MVLVEQPQKYGVRIPEGEPQSLPPWARLGLDETPLLYAPKLRGGYAAGEKQVGHYSSADKQQATATPVVNREGTVKVLQVLHRGKTGPCHARLDLPKGLPSYMHEDHAEKKCQTGDTFKRLMIKVDTEVAKDRRDHGVAQNYPCVVIMDWVGNHLDDDELKRVDDAEIRLANLYYFVPRPHTYVFFGRARRSHVSNVGDQVINPGMRAWLRDRLKRRHIDQCLKVHDGLLPKHSKLDSSERKMKALLLTWHAEWAASPLTTTHILSSWNMVFTEVPVTESVDDVDLPCPSAAIPMPPPLLSVVPGHVSDSEEASEAQAEADEASGAEVQDNIDVLSVPGTPPVQGAAKRRAETRLDKLAKRFRAAPRDVHAQRVARENRQRGREAREAVQTSDDEGTLDAFPWGAWPRDAAVTRTSKQAGKALRSQGHQLRSCHETKRFRILATLKQGNESMYSNTSRYVHMGLRLDWGKGITGQWTLSPNSYPNTRSDPLSGWWWRGLKHNPCPAQSGPWHPANRGGVPPSHRRVPGNQGAPRPTDSGSLCSLNGRSQLLSEPEIWPRHYPLGVGS